MRALSGVLLALLLLSLVSATPSSAETKIEDVSYATDLGYDFSLTDVLDYIPAEPDPSIPKPTRTSPPEEFERWFSQPVENTLARFRERGSPLAQHLFATQTTYQWFRGEIVPKDPEVPYPGGVEQLTLVVGDRDIPVAEIVTTDLPEQSVNLTNTRLITLYPQPAGAASVPYKDFRAYTSRKGTVMPPAKVYYLFLAFARDFIPGEVTGVRWGGELLPMRLESKP